MIGFFKVGAWLLEFWWMAAIALVVALAAAVLYFGRATFGAIEAAFRFLQSPAGMIFILLVAGYLCVGVGINMAKSECDADRVRAENGLLQSANKTLADALAQKDRQIADMNEVQRRHSARAIEAAAENQRLQDIVDATPKNTAPCLDRDAARRVRGIQ